MKKRQNLKTAESKITMRLFSILFLELNDEVYISLKSKTKQNPKPWKQAVTILQNKTSTF